MCTRSVKLEGSSVIYSDHIGLWANELKAWMPKSVFDAHVHLGPEEIMSPISPARQKEPTTTFTSLRWETIQSLYANLYDGITVEGMIAFGIPLREVDVIAANDYIINLMKQEPSVKGFLLADPADTSGVISQFSKAADEGVRLCGVKPYYDLLGKSNDQCTMDEFISRQLLEFMDSEELIMMLHTSGIGMSDPENQKFIMSTTAAYPRIKIVLAHMGRYYESSQFMEFMESEVPACPNVFLEISSATAPEVYERVLSKKYLRKKLMFGSDLPFGLITGQEYFSAETGATFITVDEYPWSEPEVQGRFADERTRLTYNTYHTIKALKTAIDKLALSNNETEGLKRDIFLNNAQRSLFD